MIKAWVVGAVSKGVNGSLILGLGLLSLILNEKEICGFGFGFGQSFPIIRFGGIFFPPNQLGVTFLVDNLSLSM